MKTIEKKITIREIIDNYIDKSPQELGIFGYGGKLNIRPAYQREFVYKDKQREKVIDTIFKNRPLNTMYWAVNEDNYEIIDGQQRTISIAQYVNNEFTYLKNNIPITFNNLTQSEKDDFLNYELSICFCEGDEREKLDWFETINVAGEKLNGQELANSVYTGKWLTDAKKYFSKTNCLAIQLSNDYLNGSPIRQDILEQALKWISLSQNISLREYMSKHQNDNDASELKSHFNKVINWIKTYFNFRTSFMKKVDWGKLYHLYGQNTYSIQELEAQIKLLENDDEITSKSGIYQYVLSGEEKWLSIRAFTSNQKTIAHIKQKGICANAKCKKINLPIEQMDADHITPWSKGGKTTNDNLQMLCISCNRSNK